MALPAQEEAGKKFWKMPELVERLIPFLDADTTLALVKALPLALELIQGRSMWIKLVSRVCPRDTDVLLPEEPKLEEAVAKVMPLVEILKMMEDPNPLLLDLLHCICERFPPVDWPIPPTPQFIQVSCSCEHTSHKVSLWGFLILEGVEGAMETTEQKVKRVVARFLDGPRLAALVSRLVRQQDPMDPWTRTPVGVDTEVEVLKLYCNSKESAEAISTLMEYCQSVDVRDGLFIRDANFPTEGWTALGRTLQENVVNWILTSKEALASANREDLRAIWGSATRGWRVWLDDDREELFEDDEWFLFQEFLDAEEDVKENEEEDGDEDNDV